MGHFTGLYYATPISSVVIYYYASLANALKEVNKDLLLQLTVVRERSHLNLVTLSHSIWCFESLLPSCKLTAM